MARTDHFRAVRSRQDLTREEIVAELAPFHGILDSMQSEIDAWREGPAISMVFNAVRPRASRQIDDKLQAKFGRQSPIIPAQLITGAIIQPRELINAALKLQVIDPASEALAGVSVEELLSGDELVEPPTDGPRQWYTVPLPEVRLSLLSHIEDPEPVQP